MFRTLRADLRTVEWIASVGGLARRRERHRNDTYSVARCVESSKYNGQTKGFRSGDQRELWFMETSSPTTT